jgi:hypothetical protein
VRLQIVLFCKCIDASTEQDGFWHLKDFYRSRNFITLLSLVSWMI